MCLDLVLVVVREKEGMKTLGNKNRSTRRKTRKTTVTYSNNDTPIPFPLHTPTMDNTKVQLIMLKYIFGLSFHCRFMMTKRPVVKGLSEYRAQ